MIEDVLACLHAGLAFGDGTENAGRCLPRVVPPPGVDPLSRSMFSSDGPYQGTSVRSGHMA